MVDLVQVGIEQLGSQEWRLNNLYHIVDKQGKDCIFRMNDAQRWLYNEMSCLNCILKARQMGFSTFIDLMLLDAAIFNSNTRCGIIAHTLDDAAELFKSKVRYPYDHLPEPIKALRKADTSRSKELAFSNGSSIRVGTSMRSGTLNYLHVSEYGKISVRDPGKAKEIRTGAFEAVAQGQMIFVESTAEGREGEYFDLCERARKHMEAHKPIGAMDFKFLFRGWHEEKTYRLDPSFVTMPQSMLDYFDKLEARGIKLDDWQKAWYTKKAEILGDDIKQEHPSYPEEAFEASVEGAYYLKAMQSLRQRKKIGSVPYDPRFPVQTFWDLGLNDNMAIWFHQQIGAEHHLIDYYENSGERLDHYAKVLADKGYNYDHHYLPHDAQHGNLQTYETVEEALRRLGVRPLTVVPRAKNGDAVLAGIEATRQFLATAAIDEAKCSKGIICLDNYRKKWDSKNGCFLNRPVHNEASHGADALRTGAVAVKPAVLYQRGSYEPDAVGIYEDF